MRTGRISREDAWLAFYSMIWKTLSYPLPTLNLTREECDKIMAPILQYLLPAMGVCRNFPRALVYNSAKYMGIGIQHPYTIQEIIRIKDMISHVHRCTITGKLYRTSFELLFLEIGMGSSLQRIPEEALDTLATNCLVKSTCQFLKNYDLSLHHDIKIKPLSQQDQFIMEALSALGPNTFELMSLNRCWLYLQVLFLQKLVLETALPFLVMRGPVTAFRHLTNTPLGHGSKDPPLKTGLFGKPLLKRHLFVEGYG